MGKGSRRAPKPPDFENLLRLQTDLNRVNLTTPFGSVRHTGGDPIFSQTGGQNLPIQSGAGTLGNITGGGNLIGEPPPVGETTGGGIAPAPVPFNEPPPSPDDPQFGGFGDFQTAMERWRARRDAHQAATGGGDPVQIGTTPRESTFEFSPEMQAFFDRAVTPGDIPEFDQSAINPIAGIDDFSADRASVEQALFERERALLDPVFAERERQTRNRLAAQGLPTNSEAAGGDFGELTRLDRALSQSLQGSARNAILAGGQEQTRLLGESRLGRNQQIADQLRAIDLARTNRGQEFNEFLGLLGGSQVTVPRVTPVDVTGPASLAFQGDLANFQAGQDRQAAKKGGLVDLGVAGIGAGLFGPGAGVAAGALSSGGPFGPGR